MGYKKIIKMDDYVTLLEQRLREESRKKNVMDLAQEYMSKDVAREFVGELKNLVFWRFATKVQENISFLNKSVVCGNSVFIR